MVDFGLSHSDSQDVGTTYELNAAARLRCFCFLSAEMWQPGAEDLRGVIYAPDAPALACLPDGVQVRVLRVDGEE